MPLTRHVLGDHERSQACHRSRRRRQAPRVAKGVRVEAACELDGAEKIGTLSSSARPGAKGAGSVTCTVRSSGAVTCQRLSVDLDGRRQHAVDRRVVEQRNENTTSADVNGMPSENVITAAQRQREGAGRRRSWTTFGQPRFELARDAVDPHEPRLREQRQRIDRGGRTDVTVEGVGFAATSTRRACRRAQGWWSD